MITQNVEVDFVHCLTGTEHFQNFRLSAELSSNICKIHSILPDLSNLDQNFIQFPRLC